jgi:predicted nucleic acid-binding protein
MKPDKVFLDSDIILDLLTKREPHFEASLAVFLLIQDKKVLAYTSPVVIANIFYILNRHFSREKAISSLIKIKSLIKVLSCGDDEIELALSSDFKDFEDSIQYYTALAHGMDIILTRNVKDYKTANINVSTPLEYIRATAAHLP